MFSLKNLIELFKSILKIVILLVILYNIITADLNASARTMGMSVKASAVYMLELTMNMIVQITLVFIVIAGFDYLYQRWEYERNIKMSKQELKEEFKQTEGNPEIKGRIRDLQRQRARNRMMQAVPEADVIIRNPTHFAVALKYNPEQDNAPILIAKGQDELALRIVKTGEEHGVKIIENKTLARGLYASTPLDKEIPPDYYGVVAEILVQIFKMNHKYNM